MQFYTFFGSDWDTVLVSGYRDGRKVNERVRYKPYLFVPGKGEYRTVTNKQLDRVDFDSLREARDFTKRFSEVSNFSIFGFTNYPYVHIYEQFKDVQYDPNLIRIGNIDIETDSEHGFGNIQLADKAIISISLKIFKDNVFYVLGLKDYETKEPELLDLIQKGVKIKYIKCENEKELLLQFITLWERLQLDIITGWNIELFDIPYIIKRIMFVLTEEHAKRLSPFRLLGKKTVEMFGNQNDQYEIVGIPIIDGMQAHKKFAFVNEESYSLAYIANKLLGVSKLDYSEYRTLARLYKENHNKFIDYNIIDVYRVEQIDNYSKFIDQIIMLAHTAKVNFIDTFTTVRIWDVLIHNYLMDQKIAVPGGTIGEKTQQIAGGYVKDPQVGKHDYVLSFDLTSLYPHLIMMYNISPEMLRGKFEPIFGQGSVDKVLRGDMKEYHDDMVKENVTVTGRGTVFSKEKVGFLPTLMKELFQKRKVFSKQMDQHEEDLAAINNELHRREIKTEA